MASDESATSGTLQAGGVGLRTVGNTVISVTTGGGINITAGGLNLGGTSSLTINGGVVATTSTQVLTALTIAAGATLDLNDNDLILKYSGVSPIGTWNGAAYTEITGLIKSARNGGTWDATGRIGNTHAIVHGTLKT